MEDYVISFVVVNWVMGRLRRVVVMCNALDRSAEYNSHSIFRFRSKS
jgi:hypothetical protein